MSWYPGMVATAPDAKAVGFTPDIPTGMDCTALPARIATKRDFALGCWGYSIPNDDTAALALLHAHWSASPTNRDGCANTEWDRALNAALAATDDAAKRAADKSLAEIRNRKVPSVIYETVVERVARANRVRGVYLGVSTMFYLDKTWTEG